ncbi:MAG: hypothetical protein ACRDHL_01185 [Candidatus Promineifilaceae bacterium]
MSRIINSNNAAKVRNQNLGTVAGLLRAIAARPAMDEDARDMAAAAVYLLREVYATADQTAQAWEKRGYWMKADRFLREWEWAEEAAANFEDILRNQAWDVLPRLLAEIGAQLGGVQPKKQSQPNGQWRGAYLKLLAETPGAAPR